LVFNGDNVTVSFIAPVFAVFNFIATVLKGDASTRVTNKLAFIALKIV
jgi:hypothetical protein